MCMHYIKGYVYKSAFIMPCIIKINIVFLIIFVICHQYVMFRLEDVIICHIYIFARLYPSYSFQFNFDAFIMHK